MSPFSDTNMYIYIYFTVRRIQQNHFWPLQPPASYRTSLRLEGQAEDGYRRCCSEHGRRGRRKSEADQANSIDLHSFCPKWQVTMWQNAVGDVPDTGINRICGHGLWIYGTTLQREWILPKKEKKSSFALPGFSPLAWKSNSKIFWEMGLKRSIPPVYGHVDW